MPNLNYDAFTQSVRTVLKLRNGQDDAIVDECVQAAVRDLIEEFDSDIGSRTDYTRTITQVELAGGRVVSRIYLPEDALYVRQVYVGNNLVCPIDVTDAEFWLNHRAYTTNLTGLHAFVARDEAGCMYLEFASPIEIDIECTTIRIDYRLHSSDISYIPEAYKNLVLYAALMHYRNWYSSDEAMQSKAESNYRKYLARMRADQALFDKDQKRPYETQWKEMYRFVLEGNVTDLYTRYYTS